jgi:hypothetical protein
MRKRRKVPRGKRVAALNGLGRGRGGSPDAISDMTPRQTRHPERQSVKSPGNGNGIDEQAAFNDTAPGRHRCTQGSARIGSVAKQTSFPVYAPAPGGKQNSARISEPRKNSREEGRNGNQPALTGQKCRTALHADEGPFGRFERDSWSRRKGVGKAARHRAFRLPS